MRLLPTWVGLVLVLVGMLIPPDVPIEGNCWQLIGAVVQIIGLILIIIGKWKNI